MLPLLARAPGERPLRLLAIGAHSDDIEIGCGGTILKLIEDRVVADVCWVVLTGEARRSAEAQVSAEAMLRELPESRVILRGFRDGYFPYDGGEIKAFFETLKGEFEPDLILTHQRADRHQDHRVTSELTWNTWRDHLILEYEIPKYDGDMGAPNLFVPLDESLCHRKIEHLMTHFASQRNKHWFQDELFAGLMRMRGMECNSPSAYAEAFYSHKAMLS